MAEALADPPVGGDETQAEVATATPSNGEKETSANAPAEEPEKSAETVPAEKTVETDVGEQTHENGENATEADKAAEKTVDTPAEKAVETETRETETSEPAKETERGDATGSAEDGKMEVDFDGDTNNGEEGKAEPVEEPTPKEPEKPKEEQDAVEDSRAQVAEIKFNTESTTFNLMHMNGGKLFTSFSDSGFQHLLAGARADVGLKAGRYMFEVMIVETKQIVESSGSRGGRPSHSRPLVRLGFSTAESSLILPDSDACCFDSEGCFFQGEQAHNRVSRGFETGDVVAMMLNVDQGAFAGTVSLFVGGVRATEPRPLPAALRGKALFPVVSFKNVVLRVNFGPALKPLPFVCRSLQSAAQEDCVQEPSVANGREVIVPIGLPNEGTPEWLDSFLEKNRSHVEISDRKLVEWALKSGLSQRRGGGDDRKESGLGIRELDDHSVQWMINSIAPLLSRNFVVMESGNLTVEGREATLQRYGSDFKRKAVVVMGEPPEDHKSWVDNGLLEKKRKIESEGQRGSEKVEEKTADGEKDVEMTIDQAPELTEEERNQAWFRKKETPDMSSKEMASYSSFTLPGAELFDEVDYVWQPEEKSREYLREWILEKKRMQRVEDLQPSEWFRKKWNEWGTSLTHWKNTEMEFSRNKPKRKEKREKKAKVKSEAPKEIEPKDVVKETDETKEKAAEEVKETSEEVKQSEEAVSEAKDNPEGDVGGEAKKSEEAEEPAEKAAEETKETAEKESQDVPEEKEKEQKEDMVVDAEEKEEEDIRYPEDIDVFLIKNIDDTEGEPLYASFSFEDWALLSLRFELHLLVLAFRHDIDDPERLSFHASHLLFYYNKYYKRQCNTKVFGCKDEAELLALVKDTIELPSNSILDTQLSEDTPHDLFVRLTEEARRERQRRLDMGDESVALHFSQPPARQQHSRQGSRSAPHSSGRDNYQSRDSYSRGSYSRSAHQDKNYQNSGGGGGGSGSNQRYSSQSGRKDEQSSYNSGKRTYSNPPSQPAKSHRSAVGAAPQGSYGSSGWGGYGGRSGGTSGRDGSDERSKNRDGYGSHSGSTSGYRR